MVAIEAKLHFYSAAIIAISEAIRKLLHHKYPATPTFATVFRCGWIGDCTVIETTPFVRNPYRNTICGRLVHLDLHMLRFVLFIAMNNCVIHCFSEANQNVSVKIWADFVLVYHLVQKGLDLSDAARIGR